MHYLTLSFMLIFDTLVQPKRQNDEIKEKNGLVQRMNITLVVKQILVFTKNNNNTDHERDSPRLMYKANRWV